MPARSFRSLPLAATVPIDRTRARHRLGKFLLQLGVRAPDDINTWTTRYMQWLTRLRMDHKGQQVVLEEYRQDIEESMRRVARLDQEIEACVTTGDHAAVVAALQAMRCVKLVTAASIVAEVGTSDDSERRAS